MSESCHACLGRGYVINCIDDMCNGQDECIHGDGEEQCPECGGAGEFLGDEGLSDEPAHAEPKGAR